MIELVSSFTEHDYSLSHSHLLHTIFPKCPRSTFSRKHHHLFQTLDLFPSVNFIQKCLNMVSYLFSCVCTPSPELSPSYCTCFVGTETIFCFLGELPKVCNSVTVHMVWPSTFVSFIPYEPSLGILWRLLQRAHHITSCPASVPTARPSCSLPPVLSDHEDTAARWQLLLRINCNCYFSCE